MDHLDMSRATSRTVVGLLGVVLLGCGQGKDARDSSNKLPAAVNSSDSQHLRIPLNDGKSPYENEYSQLDRWVIEHAVAQRPAQLQASEAVMRFCGTVDGDGYLIPALVQEEQAQVAMQEGVYRQYAAMVESRQVLAVGKPYAKFKTDMAEFRAQCTKIRAAYCPSIPKWLADNPPPTCWILPDGMVVEAGLAGNGLYGGAFDQPGKPGQMRAMFGLFNQDGDRIGDLQTNWFLLFMSMQQLEDIYTVAESSGWKNNEIDTFDMGLIGMKDDSGALIALYNYDGTQLLPLDVMAHKRDMHNFIPLVPEQVRDFYRSQNGL